MSPARRGFPDRVGVMWTKSTRVKNFRIRFTEKTSGVEMRVSQL